MEEADGAQVLGVRGGGEAVEGKHLVMLTRRSGFCDVILFIFLHNLLMLRFLIDPCTHFPVYSVYCVVILFIFLLILSFHFIFVLLCLFFHLPVFFFIDFSFHILYFSFYCVV